MSLHKLLAFTFLVMLLVATYHTAHASSPFQDTFNDAAGKPCACMYGLQPKTTPMADVMSILSARRDLTIRYIEGNGKLMIIASTTIGQLTVMTDNHRVVSYVSLWLDKSVSLADLTDVLGLPQRQALDSLHVGYVYNQVPGMPLVIEAFGNDLEQSGVSSIEVGDLALNWFPEDIHPYPYTPPLRGSQLVLNQSTN